MLSNHPCFNRDAHASYGRMHLPVAPACNIQCGYCNRKFSCANESRPGVTAKIITPEAACELARKAKSKMPNISVAGIAGPGDPLANPDATLKTLELLRNALPDLHLCLSTNGLALPDLAADLARLSVKYLTVTINAVDPSIGAKIYETVQTRRGNLPGADGAQYLLERQFAGVKLAKDLGMTVKINMVIVPGINDRHAAEVAKKLASLKADLMNCIPMAVVPGTALAMKKEPDKTSMKQIRAEAGSWLRQMTHCGRCRADALGLLGGGGIIGDVDQA